MISNRSLEAIRKKILSAKDPQLEFERTLVTTRIADYPRLAWYCSQRDDLTKVAFGQPFPDRYESIHDWSNVYERTLREGIWWVAATIRIYKKEICEFIHLERTFSELTLRGEHREAAQVLDAVEKATGKSLWLVEARITNLGLQGGIEEQKRYAQGLKDNDQNSSAMRMVAHYTSYKAEPNVTPERYFETIDKAFPKNVDDEERTSLPYFMFKLNFFGRYQFTNFESIIVFEGHSSLIDRYLTTVRIIQLILSDDRQIKNRSDALEVGLALWNNVQDVKLAEIGSIFNTGKPPQPLNSKFLTMLEAYSTGQYQNLLDCRADQIEQECRIAFLELRARSAMHTKAPTSKSDEPSITLNLERIEALITQAYKRGADCIEAYSALMKLVLLFPQSSWAANLYGCIVEMYPRLSNSRILKHSKFSLLNSYWGNPKFSVVFAKLISTKNPEISSEHSITSKLLWLAEKGSEQQVQDLVGYVPKLRLNKYKASAYLKQGRSNEASQLLLELMDSTTLLDNEDAAVMLIDCLLQGNESKQIFEHVVLSIADRPAILFRINVRTLWQWTKNNATKGSFLHSSIALPILCDILYGQLSAITEGERSALLEDYLTRRGFSRPSLHVDPENPIEKRLFLHLLRHLAIPNVLDSHVEYDDSLDVENERIAVCQKLSEIDPNEVIRYSSEIARITRSQLIQRGVRQVEKSKIYVDVGGIKHSLWSTSRDLYDRYKSLPRSKADLSNLILHFDNELGKRGLKLLVSLPKNERVAAFNELFLTIRNRFVSSNEHGLDVYLSVGIRHGTLAGQLRSVFEREALVGRRAADSSFVIPRVWIGLFTDPMAAPALSRLSEAIETFTDSVDAMIRELRDIHIQIQTEGKLSQGWFDYIFTTRELWHLEMQSSGIDGFDAFCDFIIEHLWGRTEQNLANVRTRLNGEIADKYALLLEKLSESSSLLPNSMGRMKFQAAITRVRPMIQAELASIATWFTRHGKGEVNSYKIDTAIDIARTMFERCNPAKSLKVDLTLAGPGKVLNGSTLPGMVDIFYLLLDNIGKYGQNVLHNELRCSIKCTLQANKLDVHIQNSVADAPTKGAASKLAQIIKQIETNSAQEQVKREGGTGLIKLAKIIRVDFGSSLLLSAVCSRSKVFNVNFTATGGKVFS
jgi:hypothetical protein